MGKIPPKKSGYILLKPFKHNFEPEIPLKNIIDSYLLNSQLATNGQNEMMLILPEEVKSYETCMAWLDKLKQISDIKTLYFAPALIVLFLKFQSCSPTQFSASSPISASTFIIKRKK